MSGALDDGVTPLPRWLGQFTPCLTHLVFLIASALESLCLSTHPLSP